MPGPFLRWLGSFHSLAYIVFFVTARCNARCRMCFYASNMEANAGKDELTLAEYDQIVRGLGAVNVVGISGGEPFLREDLPEILALIHDHCSPLVIDLPTNGYFTDKIAASVERAVRLCPHTTLDIQLSVDGPEAVHDEIRGTPGGFRKMLATYRRLIDLRKHHANLRVKACVVYSAFNQDHMPELFAVIRRDMPLIDRLVFSVAHGTPADSKALDVDWEKYFRLCEDLSHDPPGRGGRDIHSVFTQALRKAKNDFLKDVLRSRDMYRSCGAGQRVIAVSERGDVYPCEPLWCPVGNLRQNGYDIRAVMRSAAMRDFQCRIRRDKCHCHWGLPMSTTLLYSPRYYPLVAAEAGRLMVRNFCSGGKGRSGSSA